MSAYRIRNHSILDTLTPFINSVLPKKNFRKDHLKCDRYLAVGAMELREITIMMDQMGKYYTGLQNVQ